MSPRSRTLPALGLVWLAGACSSTGFDSGHTHELRAEARAELERELPLQAGGQLAVEVPIGSITARVAEGPPSVRAKIRVRAREQAQADAALDGVELDVRAVEGGARVALVSERDNGPDCWVSADLELALPPGCALELTAGTGAVRCEKGPFGAATLRSTYGEIVARDVTGGLSARTGSGSVRAERIAGGAIELQSSYGPVALEHAEGREISLQSGTGELTLTDAQAERVRLSTTYGRVTLREVRGEASAHSGSGRVEVEGWSGSRLALQSSYGALDVRGAQGDLELRGGTGDIRVEARGAALEAHTTYGKIAVEGVFEELALESGSGAVQAVARPGSRVGASWALKSGYGNVSLTLPADLAFDLEARTTYGRLDIGVPVEVAPGGLGERKVAGKVGGGGGRVSLVTGNGEVRLQPGS